MRGPSPPYKPQPATYLHPIPPQIAKKLDLMISDLQRGRPVDLRKLPPPPEEGGLADVSVGRVQRSRDTMKLTKALPPLCISQSCCICTRGRIQATY